MISVINDEISNNMDELLKVLYSNNMKFVELRKINNMYLFDISYRKLKEIKKKLSSINISLIDSPIGKNKFSHNFENDLLFKYIKICHIFNCKYLRIFSDVDNLKSYNEIAKKNNIILLVENEKNTRGEDYKYLKKITAENFSNIKILFDVENYYSLKINYKKALDCLKKDIIYIHLRDVKNGKYVFLFDGEIDIDYILHFFDNSVYISLESHLPMISDISKEKLFIENMRRLYEHDVLRKFR